MVIIDSYSESWYLADQVLADLTLHRKGIFNIPTMELYMVGR